MARWGHRIRGSKRVKSFQRGDGEARYGAASVSSRVAAARVAILRTVSKSRMTWLLSGALRLESKVWRKGGGERLVLWRNCRVSVQSVGSSEGSDRALRSAALSEVRVVVCLLLVWFSSYLWEV